MNNEMGNGSGASGASGASERAPPKQFIKKTIEESVTTGPGQQYPYPMNATGMLMKNVDIGNGKGKFSHSLTPRQSQTAMSSGEAITYRRSYKINALNPKYTAAQTRAEVNELSNLFGKMGSTGSMDNVGGGGKKRKTVHSTRRHRHTKRKTHRGTRRR
jgi:hypothetical protein